MAESEGEERARGRGLKVAKRCASPFLSSFSSGTPRPLHLPKRNHKVVDLPLHPHSLTAKI